MYYEWDIRMKLGVKFHIHDSPTVAPGVRFMRSFFFTWSVNYLRCNTILCVVRKKMLIPCWVCSVP